MHIEYLQTKNPKSQRNLGGQGTTPPNDLEQHLLQLQGTMHDGQAAALFSGASLWAYSDLSCFASLMSQCGLYGEYISICVNNEPAFIETTAYLYLSENKKLAILTFKGPEPDNLIAWLSNVNAQMTRGATPGEFFAGNIVVLPLLKDLLLGWTESSTSLAESLEWVRDNRGYPTDLFPTDEQLFPTEGEEKPKSKKKSSKKSTRTREEGQTRGQQQDRALYICGHALGGAFAASFGAMLYLDRDLRRVQDELRSVYTFGAPMFAPKSLADALDMDLGRKVFRHRYGMDPVPLLSACAGVRVEHFGQAFRCMFMESGWVPAGRFIDEVYGPMMANMFAVMSMVKEKVTMLQWLRMPFVWADNLPFRYLRTSMTMQASREFLGQAMTSDYPTK
jgi:hypothetical protein